MQKVSQNVCVPGVVKARYCTSNCSDSAMAWANPHLEDSLKFLLLKQDWKCADCQFDYRPVMQGILDAEKFRYPSQKETPLEELTWYYFKRLKKACSKEKKPEIDHILAICKGGESLGNMNHQILCYTCHKKKTAKDLSGPRKK